MPKYSKQTKLIYKKLKVIEMLKLYIREHGYMLEFSCREIKHEGRDFSRELSWNVQYICGYSYGQKD